MTTAALGQLVDLAQQFVQRHARSQAVSDVEAEFFVRGWAFPSWRYEAVAVVGRVAHDHSKARFILHPLILSIGATPTTTEDTEPRCR